MDDQCRRLKNFRGKNERTFLAYLRTISFSTTVDYLRSQKKFVDLDKIYYLLPVKNKLSKIHRKDFRMLIRIIKNNLPERHNQLFEMIYEEDLDNAEIADIMELNTNAVHQLKYRMMRNVTKIAKQKELYKELEIF